jgi:hypothetical protein
VNREFHPQGSKFAPRGEVKNGPLHIDKASKIVKLNIFEALEERCDYKTCR